MPTSIEQHQNALSSPSHSGFSEILATYFDGMIYRCEPDGVRSFERVSPGTEALTGYAPQELLASPGRSFSQLIHQLDRVRVRAAVETALRSGSRFAIEYRLVRRDGTVCWVKDCGQAVHDTLGRIWRIEGLVQDITQQRENERLAQEARSSYHNLFEHAVEGLYQATASNGFMAANPALAHMLGYDSPAAMIHAIDRENKALYVDPSRREELTCALQHFGQVLNFESQVRRRDGSVIWVSENARSVYDEYQHMLYFEGSAVDITERRDYEARFRYQASHDALTGLPNRSLLFDSLQRAVMQAQQNATQVAVAFIDLDQFKFVIDSLGHQTGDALLKTMAARLQECVRATDSVARQGGDEFVLLFPDGPEHDELNAMAARIVSVLAEPVELSTLEVSVTCSIGISVFPEHGTSAETLLRNAEAAMYQAKDAGRDTFAFYDAKANREAGERLALLTAMRRAVANNEFELHFQPRVDLSSARVVGAEALIRWNHPSRGMIMPAQFIPLAEDSGLIIAIGEWVLRRACEQQVAWQRAGSAPVPVSINLSPRQLLQGNLVEMVESVLHSTGLASHLLELEVTESVVMQDVDQSLATLARLKQLGLAIAIDDFGTGYSSLNYLKRFPVDTLKIDRSFVSDIAVERDDAAIVKAVISLGHILQMRVVAEGVETDAQRQFLVDNGCDQGQGYLFSYPLPAVEFAKRHLGVCMSPGNTGD